MCGIKKIYLVSYTPSPIDRFGRTKENLKKVSLGAEKNILWETVPSANALIKRLKKDGFLIVSIEQAKNSKDYKKIAIKDRTAFILGNEVEGIPQAILKKSDVVAEIPIVGKKESLNVSVVAGIALFRILNI